MKLIDTKQRIASGGVAFAMTFTIMWSIYALSEHYIHQHEPPVMVATPPPIPCNPLQPAPTHEAIHPDNERQPQATTCVREG